MKRNKIKPKYLKQSSELGKLQDLIQEEPLKTKHFNLFDQIENKIIKAMITLGLIVLLLVWNYIPMIFLELCGIHYTSFSEFTKIIYLMLNDCLFLMFLILIYRKEFKENFQSYFCKSFKTNLKKSLCYWGGGLLIMVISNFIISIVTNGTLASNEESVRSLIDIAPWYMAFELIIYAPISEELIFRKSIREIFQNKYLYILASGIIFGGLHVLSSVQGPLDLLYLIPYCSLGFAFAMLYQKTNNIFSTITIHSFHNTLALILYLISG